MTTVIPDWRKPYYAEQNHVYLEGNLHSFHQTTAQAECAACSLNEAYNLGMMTAKLEKEAKK